MVFSIDVDPDITERARSLLSGEGYVYVHVNRRRPTRLAILRPTIASLPGVLSALYRSHGQTRAGRCDFARPILSPQ